MIIKTIPSRLLGANCYLVASETSGTGLVIDPGADANVLKDMIDELGLSISLIVATHSHIDHIIEVGRVKQMLNVDLAIHEAEENMELWSRDWAVQLGLQLEALPNPDRLLRDGDFLKMDDLKFSVLHTPGHTPGGISLAGHGIVFTGDTLLKGNLGRTDMTGGSYEELMKSINNKLMVLPDDTSVLPGHGSKTTIGAEREYIRILKNSVR